MAGFLDNPPLEVVPPGGFQDLPPSGRFPEAERRGDLLRKAAQKPASFLTALPPPFPEVGGVVEAGTAGLEQALRALRGGARRVFEGGVDIGARGVATATEPLAAGLYETGKGMQAVAGFLGTAADTADKISKRVFVGELVLGGVAIVSVVAAWWLSRKSGGVTKILLGRARE